jgi:large subunit ribosomal protein L9
MDVILRQSVDKLGHAGDIVTVKNGYGRNYLIPGGLAYPATAGNRKRVAAEARARGQKIAAQKSDAEAIAAKLGSEELHFTANVGEGDRLFGSITSADIAAKLAEAGHVIDKRDIELAEPIKMIGVYKVPVKLHPEVRPELRVWVVKE